jgi:hypothetical protein
MPRCANGAWRVPLLRVAGQQLSPEALGNHIANWWLPNTSVLYIGKASVLTERISQYLRTPIGAPGPHRGGQWIKVLSNLRRLTVHYAELPPQWSKPEALEDDLLNAFVNRYGPVPAGHPEPLLPLPWANLSLDRPRPRRRRLDGIHPNTL